jgi:hypothetical protein
LELYGSFADAGSFAESGDRIPNHAPPRKPEFRHGMQFNFPWRLMIRQAPSTSRRVGRACEKAVEVIKKEHGKIQKKIIEKVHRKYKRK